MQPRGLRVVGQADLIAGCASAYLKRVGSIESPPNGLRPKQTQATHTGRRSDDAARLAKQQPERRNARAASGQPFIVGLCSARKGVIGRHDLGF